MPDENKKTIIPEHFTNFQCIGSQCEDTCCGNWKIDVDQDTYEKYQNLEDESIASDIKNSVTLNHNNTSFSTFAEIHLDSSNKCPLLDENKLCRIHSELGESFLSNTCATFPRITNKLNSNIERTTTMACPEAARLALLNPDPIKFHMVDDETNITKTVYNNIVDISEKDHISYSIRTFILSLLQNRQYSISERLLILGYFYKDIQSAVREQNHKKIINFINEYRGLLSNKRFKGIFDQISSKKIFKLKLLRVLINMKTVSYQDNQRYHECVEESFKGLNFDGETSLEDISENYKLIYETYFDPYIKEREHVLENYLVNYIFMNFTEFSHGSNIFDDYLNLILHFSLIKLQLVGLSGYHGKLDDDKVIKLIQSFTKVIEHDRNITSNMIKYLKNNNYDTFAHLVILLKD